MRKKTREKCTVRELTIIAAPVLPSSTMEAAGTTKPAHRILSLSFSLFLFFDPGARFHRENIFPCTRQTPSPTPYTSQTGFFFVLIMVDNLFFSLCSVLEPLHDCAVHAVYSHTRCMCSAEARALLQLLKPVKLTGLSTERMV